MDADHDRLGWRSPFCASGRKYWVLAVLSALLMIASADAQPLQDYFTNRLTYTGFTGKLLGNNSTATIELGEPKHGGKTGGHSLWISWVAPTNGVVKLETTGSLFDTLLSAYYFPSTNDTTFDKLVELARADDSEGYERESEVEFGVLQGQRYEIAVDGYFGARGPIDLQWELQPTSLPPPIVLSTPGDRSVNIGDLVSLTVVLTNETNGQYRWYFNSNELGVSGTNLLIHSFQTTNVGRYMMRISLNGPHYFTMPIEIQINTDGAANTLAQGKLLDAPGTPLIGEGVGGSSLFSGRQGAGPLGAGAGGVVRGYNGSQIFNTVFATADPNEPPHCGIGGGASYWLIYQPPANGTVVLDTIGSTYDTVMEAYTFNGEIMGYPDLISLACDNDGAGSNGAARVEFPVVTSRQYIVAVEGVNDTRGTAWLNYSLNTNQLPSPPTLLAQPPTVVVAQGMPATLAPSLAGAPPLCFSWKKDATLLPGMASPALFFPSTTTDDSADYTVTVTNDLGSVTATLALNVVVPPECSLTRASTWLLLSFPTVTGQRYMVEEADTVTGPWQPWPNFFIGDGQSLMLNVPGGGTRFYRVRVE